MNRRYVEPNGRKSTFRTDDVSSSLHTRCRSLACDRRERSPPAGRSVSVAAHGCFDRRGSDRPPGKLLCADGMLTASSTPWSRSCPPWSSPGGQRRSPCCSSTTRAARSSLVPPNSDRSSTGKRHPEPRPPRSSPSARQRRACRIAQPKAPRVRTAAPVRTLATGKVEASVAQPPTPATVSARGQRRCSGGSVQAEALAIA